VAQRDWNDLSDEYYQRLWDGLEVLEAWQPEVERQAGRARALVERYRAVEAESGVPWAVVAAIHMREADFDLTCNLCNGEPLDRVTRQVPRGRGPYATWEASALDALEMERAAFPEVWTVAGVGRFLERYNGLGYARKGEHSPYLWSGSTAGLGAGKYTEDGRYDPGAVDDQVGAMLLILALGELGPTSG